MYSTPASAARANTASRSCSKLSCARLRPISTSWSGGVVSVIITRSLFARVGAIIQRDARQALIDAQVFAVNLVELTAAQVAHAVHSGFGRCGLPALWRPIRITQRICRRRGAGWRGSIDDDAQGFIYSAVTAELHGPHPQRARR